MATNKAIQALIAAGADATKNMYDIRIKFPWAEEASPAASARATGFNVPEASNDGYDVEYHGVSLKKPSTKQTFTRSFDVTFRLDAAYALYGSFISWHQIVVDPVNGGVANFASGLGKVEVEALGGDYSAVSFADTNTSPVSDTDGAIKALESNPRWTFHDAWVGKVSQPQFSNADGGALEFTVTFYFGDCDYPFYNVKGIAGTDRRR